MRRSQSLWLSLYSARPLSQNFLSPELLLQDVPLGPEPMTTGLRGQVGRCEGQRPLGQPSTRGRTWRGRRPVRPARAQHGAGHPPLHCLAEQHDDLLLHVVLPGGLHGHHGGDVAAKTVSESCPGPPPRHPEQGTSQLEPGRTLGRHTVTSALLRDAGPARRPLGPPSPAPLGLDTPALGASAELMNE